MLVAGVITSMRRKGLKKTIILAIAGAASFGVGFLTTLHAQPPDRFDMKVREDFFAGYAGNKDAFARGMKACEGALAKNPKDAEALVWQGGGFYFQAGEAFRAGDQQKGMELYSRGLEEMKAAVTLSDTVATHIPRGAVLLAGSHYVPPDMAKPLIADGVADYERTLEIQKDYFNTLDTHARGELLFGIAEGYSRLGDTAKAEAYFTRIKNDLPNSAYAKRADTWFSTKSIPANQTGCIGCHTAK